MCSEYRTVPGFSRYAINKEGTLKNIQTGYVKKYYLAGIGYLSIRLTRDDNISTVSTKHRLLALAWLPCAMNTDDLDVNHKDGIKLNNDLTNLEWVTRQGNCIHAYSTGLRNDNKRVIVHDLVRDIKFIAYSLGEVARWFNVTPGAIHYQLNSTTANPFRGYYLWYEN